MVKKYIPSIETLMTIRFDSLSEKSRRHYAAEEALKLGYGGESYISHLFCIGRKTIRSGKKELSCLQVGDLIDYGIQRNPGGGRKKKLDEMTSLKKFIEPHIAGSPTNPEIRWVSLKAARLAALFFDEYQIKVSNGFVKRALEEMGLRFRKRTKQLATGIYQQRDEQFKIIFALIAVMMNLGMPVISIDCKKKEVIGNLYREGKCYCNKAPEVFDHDYNHLADGKVVPHGIYDLKLNRGYVTIGNSSETAAFVKDNLLWWWHTDGKKEYPTARCILILCDAGGANSYRHHIFKKEMLEFARETGLTVKVCHFPPYHSKWNPIEHRLFCHIHRAMSGNVFTSYESVGMLIRHTSTKQGLSVIVRLNLYEYKTGIKIDKNDVDYSRISYHEKIPELNYEIVA